MKSIYKDSELGEITIQTNARAKRIIFRFGRDGALQAVMPERCSQKQFEEVLEKLRPELNKAIEGKSPVTPLNESCSLTTNKFSVNIFRTDRRDFYFSRREGVLHIACPAATDFQRPEVRIVLVSGIERFLKADAKAYLPQRLRALANEFNLSFSEVKINSSQGRWGSCSSHKSINLSFYLMLLPSHLIDYVLLHELTHTLEMNHSPEFWRKLDSFTCGKALSLRKELKQFKTHI